MKRIEDFAAGYIKDLPYGFTADLYDYGAPVLLRDVHRFEQYAAHFFLAMDNLSANTVNLFVGRDFLYEHSTEPL